MKAINVNLKGHWEIFTATEKGLPCFGPIALSCESESLNCCSSRTGKGCRVEWVAIESASPEPSRLQLKLFAIARQAGGGLQAR